MRRPLLALAVLLPLLLAGPPPSALAARPFAVTASLSAAEVASGGRTILSGRVEPAREAKVAIQLRGDDGWTTVARRPLDDGGRYRHPITADEPGTYDYRAMMRRVGRVDGAKSPVVTLTVVVADVVEFTIPSGTHSADWNTEDDPVVARVGQILRVTNDDLMSHGILTTGSPFPDPGTTITPGETEDYLLTSAFDGALICSLHPSSDFWVVVSDPGT